MTLWLLVCRIELPQGQCMAAIKAVDVLQSLQLVPALVCEATGSCALRPQEAGAGLHDGRPLLLPGLHPAQWSAPLSWVDAGTAYGICT